MNLFRKIIEGIEKIRKEFYKYRSAVFWLLHEAYILDKRKFITIIFAFFAGLGILGGSLSILYKYVKLLESDHPLKIFHYQFPVRNEFMLAAVSILFMLLLISGAAFLLFAKKRIDNRMLEFNLTALKRVAVQYGWQPDNRAAWLSNSKLYSEVKKIYQGDARKSGMAMRRILNGMQHFIISFAGLFVLLWMDALATLFVFSIMLAALYFYSLVSKGAAGASRRDEELSGGASSKSRRLLVSVSSWPNPEIDREIFNDVIHAGIIRDRVKAQCDRFTSQSKSEFVSYIITAVILSFLLFFMGRNAIRGEISWALLVAYIFLLKTIMQSFKSLFQVVTVVSRYYPGIKRFYKFCRETTPAGKRYNINELHLPIVKDGIYEKSGYKPVIKKGDIAGLVIPIPFSRYSVKFISRVLSGDKKKFVNNVSSLISVALPLSKPVVPVSLRVLLGLPEEWDRKTVNLILGNKASKIKKYLSLDPDDIIGPESWARLSDDDLKAISMLGAEASTRPILVIHEQLVSEGWLKENANRMADRIVFVCYEGEPSWRRLHKLSFNFVAAVDATIIGCGSGKWLKNSWYLLKERQEQISKVLISQSPDFITGMFSDEDEDDDD